MFDAHLAHPCRFGGLGWYRHGGSKSRFLSIDLVSLDFGIREASGPDSPLYDKRRCVLRREASWRGLR